MRDGTFHGTNDRAQHAARLAQLTHSTIEALFERAVVVGLEQIRRATSDPRAFLKPFWWSGDRALGRREGEWTLWDAAGNRMADVHYAGGVAHGPFRRYSPGGDLVEAGEHRHDLRDGAYVDYHPNGTRRGRGRYERGLRAGEWTWWNAGGHLMEVARFRDGLRHGRCWCRLPDGSTLEGPYADGARSGLFRFETLGRVRFARFEGGQVVTPWLTRHETPTRQAA